MLPALAGIALSAGAGTRLAPLTWLRPKALCPVAGVPLVDLALARLAPLVGSGPDHLAVNVHHGRRALESHLGGRVHLSIEEPVALGTGGALAALRPWLDGRAAVVVNADTWCPAPPRALIEGWDGERVRVLVAGDTGRGLGPWSLVLASLLPWSEVERLPTGISGLSVVSWARARDEGRLELVGTDTLVNDTPAIDCGVPADYLAANMAASGGASVIGAGAVIEGEVRRSVVWPGGVVHRGEVLVDAIRADGSTTVLIR